MKVQFMWVSGFVLISSFGYIYTAISTTCLLLCSMKWLLLWYQVFLELAFLGYVYLAGSQPSCSGFILLNFWATVVSHFRKISNTYVFGFKWNASIQSILPSQRFFYPIDFVYILNAGILVFKRFCGICAKFKTV